MLNNIRNFAKTKYAGFLVVLLIIPFVFWGMGGMFSGGNTNNIAKINNKNISTKDFMIFLNSEGLDAQQVKENMENGILEESLAKLISSKMIDMEVEDLNIIISDKILKKGILDNKDFKDENNNFSRTKYEKFLLSSNLTAPEFEFKLRENELQRELFKYISGGIKTPDFLIKNNYREQTKKIVINYLNLTKIYKKKENFTKEEIINFIEENKDNLKEKVISFKYIKITPKELIGIDEFNSLFFEKIDEIENDVSNGNNINELKTKYKLKVNSQYELKASELDNKNIFFKKIYENASDNKIEIIDETDFYILYEITEIKKVLPNEENEKFIAEVREKLFDKFKFKFNNDLIKKIGEKKFSQNDFKEISKKNSSEINKIEIDSINDYNKFTKDSIKYLYSLSKNDFGLVGDKEKNIYLVEMKEIIYKDFLKSAKDVSSYEFEEKEKLKSYIFGTYDYLLNDKYKIKVNEKTMERVKNYFR